jgi:hypothetical protein
MLGRELEQFEERAQQAEQQIQLLAAQLTNLQQVFTLSNFFKKNKDNRYGTVFFSIVNIFLCRTGLRTYFEENKWVKK